MIKELMKKSDVELGELISTLKIQLLEYRFKMANGEVEDLHKIKETKKMIAMAMTVLSQRNIEVSFTTHTIQLIKKTDKKQEIKAIKLKSLATEVKPNKDAKKTTKKETTTKAETKPVANKKPAPKAAANKEVTKPASKQSTNTNLKSSSNNRQKTVAIRRTAKG